MLSQYETLKQQHRYHVEHQKMTKLYASSQVIASSPIYSSNKLTATASSYTHRITALAKHGLIFITKIKTELRLYISDDVDSNIINYVTYDYDLILRKIKKDIKYSDVIQPNKYDASISINNHSDNDFLKLMAKKLTKQGKKLQVLINEMKKDNDNMDKTIFKLKYERYLTLCMNIKDHDLSKVLYERKAVFNTLYC